MLVSAAPFFVFLVAVCLLYWAAAGSRRLRLAVLVAANLFFLARFSLVYLALPLAASADYFVGLGLGRFQRKTTRRLLLCISLAVNLGLLAGLKLLPLLTAGRFAWLFPLSLSFYCFQSLTYTVDLYFGEMRPTPSYLAYLASALFFPSMTAGPIPRQGKLLDQISRPFAFNAEDAGRALLLISVGLVKKLLIADFLANNLVNRVFDTPALYSSVETLVAVYAYALQLFFDFSGYTDIAMGAALLLGIRLPENFRQPYFAVNVAEFWRRCTSPSPSGCATTSSTCFPSGASIRCSHTAMPSWSHSRWAACGMGSVGTSLSGACCTGWRWALSLPGSCGASFPRPTGGPNCWEASSPSTLSASPGYSSAPRRLKTRSPSCADWAR